MRVNRSFVLLVLAGLTVCFLGAAFALWFNPVGLPIVGADGLGTPRALPILGEASNNSLIQLTIPNTGVVALTASHLREAGLNFNELSSSELALTHNGRQVPFIVRQLDDNPTLYFYAETPDDPHEPLAVYELRRGMGLAMDSRDAQPFGEGDPTGVHHLGWEENRFFVEESTAADAWKGPLLLAPDQWTLHLDAIYPDGDPATLLLRLFTGVETSGDQKHHIEVQLNGRSVAEHYWSGAGEKTIRVPLEDGQLKAGTDNSLTVIVHDDTAPAGESIYIDSLELDYLGPIDISDQAMTFVGESPNLRIDGAGEDVIVLDISEASEPVHLTNMRSVGESVHLSTHTKGARFIALNPASAQTPELETVSLWDAPLTNPERGADYIAVVADVRGFDEALAPLLAHRQEQGLRVEAVALEQIYDEFSYGHRDPDAIRSFIEYATAQWTPPAPRYVLLVGDANYDVTNQIPGKNRNRLPTQMIYQEFGGHVASDGWFVAGDSAAPQVAIGRFPAQNAPQLSNMVNKTIAYEQELANGGGAWTGEALLVADDQAAYDEQLEELAHYLRDGDYAVYRLQMSQDENIRHNIVSAINQGVGLISYMGQGSESTWGDEAVFQNSDAQSLFNNARLPIFDTFTCRSGAFANPQTDSLAESLLRTNGGGIVASVAPSGSLPESVQLPLSLLFHEQFMNDAPRLGDKLLSMYRLAGQTPELREALASINLLGDPALQVSSPTGS